MALEFYDFIIFPIFYFLNRFEKYCYPMETTETLNIAKCEDFYFLKFTDASNSVVQIEKYFVDSN